MNRRTRIFLHGLMDMYRHAWVFGRSCVRLLIYGPLGCLFPRRFSMVHGARWMHEQVRICRECGSVHPMDMISLIRGLHRWTPDSAIDEISSLIDRGEVENTAESWHRLSAVGPGQVFLIVRHGIVRFQTVHGRGFTKLDHLNDLDDHQLLDFLEWATSLLPELEFDVMGNETDIIYTPDLDPMMVVD